jgi:glycerol uptake facilitator-like aquaporin
VLLVGVLTATAVLSVRAADAASALAGLAAATAFGAWCLSRLGPGGLALFNPSWAVALLLRRRLGAGAVLPAWAAAAVGALAFSILGGWLIRDLPQLTAQTEPSVLPASVVLLVAGVISAWAAVIADGPTATALLATAPVLIAGTALPPAYSAAANPAVAFGLGVGGVASWTYVYVSAVALLAGGVLGGLTAPLLSPGRD